MFVLFIGETELCHIPGLSSAASNPDIVGYTAACDADIVRFGFPQIVDWFPADPQGHPTPALITRAACSIAELPVMVVQAGSRIAPSPGYWELGTLPGRDPQRERAVSDAGALYRRSHELGRLFSVGTEEPYVIGESVPGGTTTALFLLRALGYQGMVSSASPYNPVALKERVWQNVCERLGGNVGGCSSLDALEIASEVGDPMQIAVAGFVSGLPHNAKIVLAGGTQMLAVAALLRAIGDTHELSIATTCYVLRDRSASFSEYAEKIGVPYVGVSLDFSSSRFSGLADYEKGFIKEGVGAGGSVWYAEQKGFSPSEICRKTEQLYAELFLNGAAS